MAIVWSNTFDGPNDTTVTEANSGSYGDALSVVGGTVTYDTGWSADGTASLRMGAVDGTDGGDVQADIPASLPDWSVRVYLSVPSGGWVQADLLNGVNVPLWGLDDDLGDYTIGGIDVSAHTASLIGQPLRVEVAVVSGTATYRVWWTDPHSTGTPDWEDTGTAPSLDTDYSVVVQGGGFSTPPAHLDELAIAEGEWIGPRPASVTGAVEGALALSGTVSGYKRAHGTVEGSLAAEGALEGAVRPSARGRLTLAGTVSGGKHTSGSAEGSLALSGTVEGYKRAYGTVEGQLAVAGALAQLIVPVPALSVSVSPVGRLAATAVRK